MILVAFRHGLRSSELTDLRWDQVDFAHAVLHVRRAKKGVPSTHPIRGDELRALRKLQREQDPKSPFVFTSPSGNSPFTTAGFARMVERAGVEAKLGFPAHPHMLRHACGFALANKGHDTRALAGLLGPSKHPAHGALHRAVARPLQGLLPMTPPRDSRGRFVRRTAPGPLPPHVILPVRRAVPPVSWPLQRHDCASH